MRAHIHFWIEMPVLSGVCSYQVVEAEVYGVCGVFLYTLFIATVVNLLIAEVTGIMGREGMLDKASELFEEMPMSDVEWNVYSFTALINAYGRNGQHEASLHLLARMKREMVTPNLITYNTVINACAKGGLDWEGLLGLFAQMRHEGIQPDIITYNTLLSACSRFVVLDFFSFASFFHMLGMLRRSQYLKDQIGI